MVNEFVVVRVGGKWRAVYPHGITLAMNCAAEAYEAAVGILGGDWDGRENGDGFRYTRKPAESPAERVARECAREVFRRIEPCNSIAGRSESDFAEIFAPLIATVAEPQVKLEEQRDAAEGTLKILADIVQPAEDESIYDACQRLRARVAELESQLDCPLARRQVGPDGIVPGNTRECAELWEREAARLFKQVAELDIDYWRQTAVAARDHWRQRFEQLRDAVERQSIGDAGLTRWSSIRERIRDDSRGEVLGTAVQRDWARAVLPRLEAALKEPEPT